MRNLRLLGRKLLKRQPITNKQDRSDSTIESVLSTPTHSGSKIEYRCPLGEDFDTYCENCEATKTFEVIEVIENGNIEHRFKCKTCGVILQ